MLPTIDETLGPETTLLRDDYEGAGHVLASSEDCGGAAPNQAAMGSQSVSSWEDDGAANPATLRRGGADEGDTPRTGDWPVASVQSWDEADAESFEARLEGATAAPAPPAARVESVIAGQVAALRARLGE